VTLPGISTPWQGQLAVMVRENDQGMLDLFAPLDIRRLPKALYFGPELPLAAFPDRWLHHFPLIRIKQLPPDQKTYSNWNQATHVIFTSKNAVKTTLQHLKMLNIPLENLKEKIVIAIGKATALTVPFYKELIVASKETQEGVIELLHPDGYYFYPHSALARPLINEKLAAWPHTSFAAYTIEKDPLTSIPDLEPFSEAIFSSPSAVKAFFKLKPMITKDLKMTAIGPVTFSALAKFNHLIQTEIYTHKEMLL
jgi:uroporphyrinogen-III synthase